MCSSNVHGRICIDQGKGFSQRMTSNKTHESVQIKPNHNNQQARGSSSRGLVPNLVRYCKSLLFQIVKQILVNLVVHLFYERRFLVNGTSSPPRDTQLPFDMLFMTMFYTCHVTEVVYHRGGGGGSFV